MSDVICDKAGYALSLKDRVRIEIVSKKPTVNSLVGEVTGFNPLAVYSIRVSFPNGSFEWYRRSEVRKLANRTPTDARINPRPFRRA